jgi:hypothetical protein
MRQCPFTSSGQLLLDSRYLLGEICGMLLPVARWQSSPRAAALNAAESLCTCGSEAQQWKPILDQLTDHLYVIDHWTNKLALQRKAVTSGPALSSG